MDDVDQIVATLGLPAHPEGGLFVETRFEGFELAPPDRQPGGSSNEA